MSEANKRVVRRYFEEVLDGGDRSIMPQLFLNGAPQHFPGRTVIFDASNPGGGEQQRMHTSLHHVVAEDDFVMVRLTHRVSFGDDADLRTRLGTVDVSKREIEWSASVLFRFERGRIAEEWVNRDELYILMQLDAVALKSGR